MREWVMYAGNAALSRSYLERYSEDQAVSTYASPAYSAWLRDPTAPLPFAETAQSLESCVMLASMTDSA